MANFQAFQTHKIKKKKLKKLGFSLYVLPIFKSVRASLSVLEQGLESSSVTWLQGHERMRLL